MLESTVVESNVVCGAVRDAEEHAAAALTTERATVTRFRDAARETAGLLVQSERVRRAAARCEKEIFPLCKPDTT